MGTRLRKHVGRRETRSALSGRSSRGGFPLFGLRQNFLVKKRPEPSTPEFRAADLDNAKFVLKGKLRARTPRYSVNESSLRNADTCTTFRPAKSIKKKLKKKGRKEFESPWRAAHNQNVSKHSVTFSSHQRVSVHWVLESVSPRGAE